MTIAEAEAVIAAAEARGDAALARQRSRWLADFRQWCRSPRGSRLARSVDAMNDEMEAM